MTILAKNTRRRRRKIARYRKLKWEGGERKKKHKKSDPRGKGARKGVKTLATDRSTKRPERRH